MRGRLRWTFVLLVVALAPCAVDAQQPKGLPAMESMRRTGPLKLPGDPNRFTFIVFGDSQGQEKHPTLYAIFEDKPDETALAVSLGDIIRGEPTVPFQIKNVASMLRIALDHAEKAGVPVFNAPGNHEMDDVVDPVKWLERPSPQMRKAYEQVVAPTYGSFDYGNSHFIVLNTEDLPPPNLQIPESVGEFSYIGKTQLAELEADLEANKDKTHIFIAMHYPIHAYRAEDQLLDESRQSVLNMFKKYKNISFVLASHEHIYYNPRDPNNVTTIEDYMAGDDTRYLISGGAGAKFHGPQQLCFHHYLLFEVAGDKVSVKIRRVR